MRGEAIGKDAEVIASIDREDQPKSLRKCATKRQAAAGECGK